MVNTVGVVIQADDELWDEELEYVEPELVDDGVAHNPHVRIQQNYSIHFDNFYILYLMLNYM